MLLHFPSPLSKDFAHLLYQVCDVDIYVHNTVLGYVISLPLMSKDNFDVLKLTSIPIAVEQRNVVHIDVDKTVLYFDKA